MREVAIFSGAGLHSIQKGGIRDRKIMQVVLECTIVLKTHLPHGPYGSRRIGAKPLGCGADAEFDKLAGVFKHGPGDLLPVRAELGGIA